MTYTLTIQHIPTIPDLLDVSLFDILPEDTSLVYATPPFVQNGATITWNWSQVSSSASHSVQLVVQTPITISLVTNRDYGILGPPVISGPPVVVTAGTLLYFPLMFVQPEAK